MYKTLFALFFSSLLLCSTNTIYGQEYRYFEFRFDCGFGDWQDTSIIVTTRIPELIDLVYDEMERPYEERRFIVGLIAPGDGGFNFNGSHAFDWHFVPDEWALADVAAEVCDGCPYSDVDADADYWLNTLGVYCPWSARPWREVERPVLARTAFASEAYFRMYPNPAYREITVEIPEGDRADCVIYDLNGRPVIHRHLAQRANIIDVYALNSGLYTVEMAIADRRYVQRLIIP